ncbi:MAG: TIGR04086 family membrane protein [Tuberibacillus sp.]
MTRRMMTACSYGIIAALILIMAAAFVLASLLKLTSLSEAALGSIPMIIVSLAALFIGGVIAGAKMKEKGLLTGAATGLIYSLIIYLFLFLGLDRAFSGTQYFLIVANTAVTGMGGIIGVNLFVNR